VPERNGRELLYEWRKLVDSVLGSAASAAGRSGVPRDLVGAMQRQLELVQEVVEREGRLPRQFAGLLVAPIDAVFDLLEETGATLSRQAEALQAAGSALEETAALMKRQAELFERTVTILRQPTELAKVATGLERQSRKGKARPPFETGTRRAPETGRRSGAGARGAAGAEGEPRAQDRRGAPSQDSADESSESRASRGTRSAETRMPGEGRAPSKTSSRGRSATKPKTGARRESSAPRRKPPAPRS
jgi:hypothetical protein